MANFIGSSLHSRSWILDAEYWMLSVETLDALWGNSIGVPMKAPEELREMRGEDEASWA